MIRFSLDPAARVRIATFTGCVDDDELMEAYRAEVAKPDYDYRFDDLVDLREIGRLDVTGAGLRSLTQLFAEGDAYGYQTRLAIVASRDVAYGMGRMYEALREGAPEQIGVFRELAEALDWLRAGRE